MDSSTSPHGRKRAPTMSPQARREAIIEATMPLLTEHGTAITTKQIATAAGIAEGTVFRVFEDKAELILACLHASMRSDAEVASINSIPAQWPLPRQLSAVVSAVSGYLDRMWTFMSALGKEGHRPDRHKRVEGAQDPREQMEHVSTAVTTLLARHSLRVDPDVGARLLLGLIFANRMQRHTPATNFATDTELVDLFQHGALSVPSPGASTGPQDSGHRIDESTMDTESQVRT